MLSNSAPSPPNHCNSARYHGIQSHSHPLQPCLVRKGLGAALSSRRAISAPKASQFSGERLAALGALSSRSNADSHFERSVPSGASERPLASATPRPTPQPLPQPLLARLWTSLCSAAGLALRVIIAAFAIWLAGLLPRPSLAAAAASASAGEARVAPSNTPCSGCASGAAAAAGGFASELEVVESGAESLAARCLSGYSAGPSGASGPAVAWGARRAAVYSGSSGTSSSGAAGYSPVLGELALAYETAAPGAAVFRSTAPSARGASHQGQGSSHGSSSNSSSTYVYGSTTGYGSQQGLQPAAAAASGIGSSSSLGGSGLTASADAGAAASNAGGASAADSAGSAAAGGGSSSSGSSSSSTPSSSSSSGVAAAALPPGVTAEDVALASALGLGVGEAAVVRLFERCRPSVVNISGMRAMQTFTTLDLTKVPTGQGSGFIWGDKGCVVTAYHLVKGAAEVKVTLYDNSSYTAKVLGYDAAKDIAVLKLSVPKSKLRELQPVTPGSAAGLRVGQSVYGIANPWGLGHTLSQGLVSGLGCELSGCGLLPLKGVIAANTGLGPGADPGSSGGVLLDSKGAVVGMLVSPPASGGGGGGGGGRSYAVPLDAVRGLVGQILSYGRTVRPALGITMAPPQVLERVGVEGVLVLEVPPGSPAHAAGLRPTHRDIFGDLVLGDVVVGLDGKPVRTASDLYDILDEHRVGDRIKLDVLRDGKATGLTITLGERVLGGSEE